MFIRSSWNFRFEVTETLPMVVCLHKTSLNNDSRLNCTSVTRVILRGFVSTADQQWRQKRTLGKLI